MLGTTVIIPTILVPLMGGGDVEKAEVIETLLFVAGINTLLQTVFGTRLPVVIGGSYAFIIPAVSIALSRRFSVYIDPHQRFKQTMRAIQGAVIVASFFQMILCFLGFVRIFGRFLSPLSAVPLVTLTGLGFFVFGFPQVADERLWNVLQVVAAADCWDIRHLVVDNLEEAAAEEEHHWEAAVEEDAGGGCDHSFLVFLIDC